MQREWVVSVPVDSTQDEELVRRSLVAQDAFGMLVARYYCTVYSVAYARAGQREAAEEIAQEAFLRAYLNLKTLKQTDRFSAWICCIARNVAENWRVRGQTRSRLVPMVPLDTVEAEIPDARGVSARDRLQADEESAALQAALARLPDEQREVVVLHFLEGLSKSEIAQRFGMHPSTIGRQLDRALDWLRGELGGTATQAARAMAPRRAGASRAALVILAAAALPHSAKAALETAAAADGIALATSGSLSAAAHATPLLQKFVLHATHGGKTMLITKGLAVSAVIAAVVTGTVHHQGADKDKATAAQIQAGSTTQTGAGAVRGVLPKDIGTTGAAFEPPASAATAGAQGQNHAPLTAGATPQAAPTAPAPQSAGTKPTPRQTMNAVPAVAAAASDPVEEGICRMVQRTKADMRSMATAIEAYYVDNNCYPSSDPSVNLRKVAPGQKAISSFTTTSLTTPIAYITSIPSDPFAGEGQIFGYHMATTVVPGKKPESAGWILLSPGPDGRFDLDPGVYRADPDPKAYSGASSVAPQPELIAGAYDPTNGTVSAGDIWRIKQ